LPEETTKNTDKEILKEDELLEEEAPLIEHLKTKPVPAIVTLLGGAVAAIYTYIQGREPMDALIIILVTLLVFLILGDLIKFLLDKIEIVVEPEKKEDEASQDEETEGQETEETS
jgi:hypothetical protein